MPQSICVVFKKFFHFGLKHPSLKMSSPPLKRRKVISPNPENIWEKFGNETFSSKTDPWVSGSEVHNYLLKDPLLDWLKNYYPTRGLNENPTPFGRSTNKDKNYSGTSIPSSSSISEISSESRNLAPLLEKGNEFEHKINDYLLAKFPGKCKVIATEGRVQCDPTHCSKTLREMKKGTPIILSGVLYSEKHHLKGIADILVRSDWINKLTKELVLSHNEIDIEAPELRTPFHYVVIDIKWSCMSLCTDGKKIRNEGRFRGYKGQLCIYNFLLGLLQGYTPNKTFVMAKSWKIDSSNPRKGYDCFDLMGCIDYFSSFDGNIVDSTIEAIHWLRNLKKNGRTWSPLSPHIPEMYPNACNTHDAPWTQVKKELIEKLGEITHVWNVRPENRNYALQQGITSWRDPRCNTETLKINPGKNENIITKILEVNHQDRVLVSPEIVPDHLDWRQPRKEDMCLDLEFTNTLLTTDINIRNSQCIPDLVYMIGVGFEENGKWNYISFVAPSLDLNGEAQIIRDFHRFLRRRSVKRFIHYTKADPNALGNAFERTKMCLPSVEWFDLHKLLSDTPIVIKNCLTFKIKDVGNALYKNGLIDLQWDDNGPLNGFDAMIEGTKFYSGKDSTGIDSIVRYNEIDVRMMWEILKYLRNNH